MKFSLLCSKFLTEYSIVLCIMSLLVRANRINTKHLTAFEGENITIRCRGRNPKWFYKKKPDTTITGSPISYNQELRFRATIRHAGFYFCYANFPQENRSFLSRVGVQVVSGKL